VRGQRSYSGAVNIFLDPRDLPIGNPYDHARRHAQGIAIGKGSSDHVLLKEAVRESLPTLVLEPYVLEVVGKRPKDLEHGVEVDLTLIEAVPNDAVSGVRPQQLIFVTCRDSGEHSHGQRFGFRIEISH
jgi:hypothetical protein